MTLPAGRIDAARRVVASGGEGALRDGKRQRRSFRAFVRQRTGQAENVMTESGIRGIVVQ